MDFQLMLNESIAEVTALERFLLRQGFVGQVRELRYAVEHGPHLGTDEPAAVNI